VKRRAQSANLTSAVLLAIVLVTCSISGLAAGVYARHLGERLAAATKTVSAPASSATSRAASTATSVPLATATVTPQSAGAVAFVLTVSSSPNTLSAGQSFNVSVTALTQNGGAAVVGLRCFMRAPTDGRAPLFQNWPTPQITDANGRATWNLVAPQVASGLYGVEVVAYGVNSYNYFADTFVTIGS